MNKRTPINDDSDYLALKVASRRLTSAVGGIDGAVGVTGKSRSVHGSYQNPSEPTFMPLDIIYDMESVSKQGPLVTEQLAALHGMMLVTAPSVPGEGGWGERVCGVSKECCEAVGKINQAFNKGGVISPDEIDELNLIAEADDAIKALLEIKATFELIKADQEGEG